MEIQRNEYMNADLKTLMGNRHRFILMFLLGIAFAISYAQSPLYTANQNTYLLHGLANGQMGALSSDWMANTTDPFPLFSSLISLTYSHASPALFYLFYAAILGIFIFSIMGITAQLSDKNRSNVTLFCTFVVITAICSNAFSNISQSLIGINLSKLFTEGAAGQYILGDVFQPSTFGVFLLLSIYTFLKNKPFLAVVFLGVAANFHATYLLSGAALTLSYMVIIILDENKYKKALYVGVLSLTIVAPTVIYSLLSFAATSTDNLNLAQSILVNYRIPHHANINVWFSVGAVIKIAIIMLALLIQRKRRRVWLILLIPFVISIVLTIVQWLTKSHFLALLFPWRLSAFLVPLSSFIVASSAISYLFCNSNLIDDQKKAINVLLTIILSILIIFGLSAHYFKYKRHNNAPYIPMMTFVANTMNNSDVYLIPPKMDRFRLQAGARILIDHKTHPYKDNEILNWHERLQLANNFYNYDTTSQCNSLNEISDSYEVTHVVINNDKHTFDCNSSSLIFDDGQFSVFKLLKR